MRVLVYGGFYKEDQNLNRFTVSIAEQYGRSLIRRGHSLVTREGLATVEGIMPIENMVLKGAIDFCGENSIPIHKRILSIGKPSPISEGKHYQANRPLQPAPSDSRAILYRLLIENSDVLVLFGGRTGVQRMALLWQFLDMPVLSIAFTGGAAEQIWQEARPSDYGEFWGGLSSEEFMFLNEKNLESNEVTADRLVEMTEKTLNATRKIPLKNQQITTIGELFGIMSTLSPGQVWKVILVIFAVLSGLLSVAYYLGHLDLLQLFK